MLFFIQKLHFRHASSTVSLHYFCTILYFVSNNHWVHHILRYFLNGLFSNNQLVPVVTCVYNNWNGWLDSALLLLLMWSSLSIELVANCSYLRCGTIQLKILENIIHLNFSKQKHPHRSPYRDVPLIFAFPLPNTSACVRVCVQHTCDWRTICFNYLITFHQNEPQNFLSLFIINMVCVRFFSPMFHYN